MSHATEVQDDPTIALEKLESLYIALEAFNDELSIELESTDRMGQRMREEKLDDLEKQIQEISPPVELEEAGYADTGIGLESFGARTVTQRAAQAKHGVFMRIIHSIRVWADKTGTLRLERIENQIETLDGVVHGDIRDKHLAARLAEPSDGRSASRGVGNIHGDVEQMIQAIRWLGEHAVVPLSKGAVELYAKLPADAPDDSEALARLMESVVYPHFQKMNWFDEKSLYGEVASKSFIGGHRLLRPRPATSSITLHRKLAGNRNAAQLAQRLARESVQLAPSKSTIGPKDIQSDRLPSLTRQELEELAVTARKLHTLLGDLNYFKKSQLGHWSSDYHWSGMQLDFTGADYQEDGSAMDAEDIDRIVDDYDDDDAQQAELSVILLCRSELSAQEIQKRSIMAAFEVFKATMDYLDKAIKLYR